MKDGKEFERWVGHLAESLRIQMNGIRNGNNRLRKDNSKQERRSIHTPAGIFPGNFF